MDKLYSVEQLASQASVSSRTVRLYVERGILHPLRAGRTLCFTPEDLKRLGDVLRAKRLGFSLRDIKRDLDDPTRERLRARHTRVAEIKADAETELAALDRQLNNRR